MESNPCSNDGLFFMIFVPLSFIVGIAVGAVIVLTKTKDTPRGKH
jgi:hypothetical protein